MSNAAMRRQLNESTLQLTPYLVADDETRTSPADELHISMKATSSQTGGAFNLLHLTASAGYATPLHIHYAEDVAFYVLEGALTVFQGDEGMDAPAGTYVFMPRGTPHGFRVKAGGCARILYLTVPGGIDGFTHGGGFGAEADECVTLAARYKIEILGPLPD